MCRFQSFERSLHTKGQFQKFEAVINECFEAGYAEEVPEPNQVKPPHEVFYLHMHLVRKESSTTTNVRNVFDASAKTSTGIAIIQRHPPCGSHCPLLSRRCVALLSPTTSGPDCQMYRAIALTNSDKDLYRFVWPQDTLKDF